MSYRPDVWIELWDAINAYAESYQGGVLGNIPRQKAVVRVEDAVNACCVDFVGPTSAPDLHVVVTAMCAQCLAGKGGECHTPGCCFWMRDGPARCVTNRCSYIDGKATGEPEDREPIAPGDHRYYRSGGEE